MIEKLIQQLKKANPRLIPDESVLTACFDCRQLKKNEILLNFHTVCRHYYFVNKGALRIFFLNDGKEYTSWFAFDNYFFTELESYTGASSSKYCIVAIEDTEILQITKTDMERLLVEYDWWKDFLLYNQEQIIIKLIESVKSFQAQTAQDRYEKLFRHPEFIQRTKQKDLSSMLGVTRHSLSRLRKKSDNSKVAIEQLFSFSAMITLCHNQQIKNMEKENFFKDEKHSFSPMDSYRWIEQGVFGYLQEKSVLNDGEQSKFRDIYYQKFESALHRVEHLITSDPDRGNVSFVLTTVATFESFLALGITENKAILLTDNCINKPMYNYLVHGIKKQFDESADPFRTLVQSSKDREENYFGNSFEFERPIDDEYGYVLHIKRCLFHETLKVLDRRELQPILCEMDLAWINGIDHERHGMQFVRPVTFATGNTCQFWFIRREKLNKMEPG